MSPSDRETPGGPIIEDESPIASRPEELDIIGRGSDEFPDNFYRGLIVYLDPVRGRGTIRSYSGREIHFEFPVVSIVGAPIGGRFPGLDQIRQGDLVGFDVGWTSKGLRITRIKPAR
jgi:hypothetical protein